MGIDGPSQQISATTSTSIGATFLDLSRLDQGSLVYARAWFTFAALFPGKIRGSERPRTLILIKRVFARFVGTRRGAPRPARAAKHVPKSLERIPRARDDSRSGRGGAEREHARVKRTRSVAAYLGGVRVWVLGTKNFDG